MLSPGRGSGRALPKKKRVKSVEYWAITRARRGAEDPGIPGCLNLQETLPKQKLKHIENKSISAGEVAGLFQVMTAMVAQVNKVNKMNIMIKIPHMFHEQLQWLRGQLQPDQPSVLGCVNFF